MVFRDLLWVRCLMASPLSERSVDPGREIRPGVMRGHNSVLSLAPANHTKNDRESVLRIVEEHDCVYIGSFR